MDTMARLLRLCADIDRAARDLYRALAAAERAKRFRACWQKMADDGERRIACWSRLVSLAGDGIVPRLFDEPKQALKELRGVAREIAAIPAHEAASNSGRERAAVALRLEVCLLSPAFGTLRYFLHNVEGTDAPDESYDERMDGFLVALAEYAKGSPELELIARATRQLWLRNRQLLKATHTDPLTGLHNYRGFWTAVLPLANLARRRKEPVAALTLDVDSLKSINDALSHAAGNEVLHDVADVLRSALREADIACRFGGDEFVAFLTGVSAAGLEAVERRIRKAAGQLTVRGRRFTISIGAAQGHLEGDMVLALEQLLHQSDERMYAAKQANRAQNGRKTKSGSSPARA